MLIYVHESGENLSPGQGQGGRFPGRRITVEGAESPNKVTRAVFNAVHLLPKNRICEHGAANLLLAPSAI